MHTASQLSSSSSSSSALMGFLSESLQQKTNHDFTFLCFSHRMAKMLSQSCTRAVHVQTQQLNNSTQALPTITLQCKSQCADLLDQVQSSLASGILCVSFGSSIYKALNTLSPPISTSIVQRGVLLVVLCL